MNNTLKKFLFILSIVLISAAIFACGVFWGTKQNYLGQLFTISFMEKTIVETRMTFRDMQYLDEGNFDALKKMINGRLDRQIITIDVLLEEYPNEKDKSRAIWLLGKIAQHREKYPVNMQATEFEKANKRIQNILSRSLSEVEKD
ncbi:MAG: hypothetical protein OEV42_20475 [Deltaproteobacteria bacterium]|nr:hypothetical protein [Deltaproteobacteria bacterium]